MFDRPFKSVPNRRLCFRDAWCGEFCPSNRPIDTMLSIVVIKTDLERFSSYTTLIITLTPLWLYSLLSFDTGSC